MMHYFNFFFEQYVKIGVVYLMFPTKESALYNVLKQFNIKKTTSKLKNAFNIVLIILSKGILSK